jgi:hypothetical protein
MLIVRKQNNVYPNLGYQKYQEYPSLMFVFASNWAHFAQGICKTGYDGETCANTAEFHTTEPGSLSAPMVHAGSDD